MYPSEVAIGQSVDILVDAFRGEKFNGEVYAKAIGIAPEGSTPEYTDRYARQMEGVIKTAPDVENFFTIVGFPTVTQTIQLMLLQDWAERERSQQDVTGELAGKLYGGIPGVLAFAMNPPSLGQSPIDKAVEIVIQSSGS